MFLNRIYKLNLNLDLNPFDFWAWNEIRKKAYRKSDKGRFKKRDDLIKAVQDVWENEIDQETINHVVTSGFYNRLEKVIEREGGDADGRQKRPREDDINAEDL